ncbi:hypothetical protein E2C01_074523 [Portunus trituberculatus]|uniref:Uncharacterized protein n=1 Tax=Portunus trituberculatus TaxID=210409 RepID=A0A5B7IHG8_PORTR|nr:hypothetical protein [Portunus trituberculatus]
MTGPWQGTLMTLKAVHRMNASDSILFCVLLTRVTRRRTLSSCGTCVGLLLGLRTYVEKVWDLRGAGMGLPRFSLSFE